MPPATLQIRKELSKAPYYSLTLPDTGGAWRYITYDMDTAKLRGSAGGESLAYYTVVGSPKVAVDIDAVNLQAKSQLTPPTFPQGADTRLVAVAGEPLSVNLSATGTVSYRADALPSGASLNAQTGVLTWTPTAGQVGDHRTSVVADDGTSVSVLRVVGTVAANRAAAITAALAGYDPETVYVKSSAAAVATARAAAETDLSADSATFAGRLVAVQAAVAGLEKLTLAMADDGSFDYWGRATSASLSQVALGNMLDGDFNTFSGDLRAPAIIDYGSGFRVRADAFGLQARYNFANRTEARTCTAPTTGRRGPC